MRLTEYQKSQKQEKQARTPVFLTFFITSLQQEVKRKKCRKIKIKRTFRQY